MKAIKIDKDSMIINLLAEANTILKINATVSCEGSSKDKKWRNLAIQDIQFTFMNKSYVLDHIWLQERDMRNATCLYNSKGKKVELICKFYKYRNDKDSNKCGIQVIKARFK